MHKIFQMEKVMPTFEYELLILSPKPKTLDEEKDIRNVDGALHQNIRKQTTRSQKKEGYP